MFRSPYLPPCPPSRFVSSNAQRLLKLDTPNVVTVSSRGALKAKMEVAK